MRKGDIVSDRIQRIREGHFHRSFNGKKRNFPIQRDDFYASCTRYVGIAQNSIKQKHLLILCLRDFVCLSEEEVMKTFTRPKNCISHEANPRAKG